MVEISVVEVKDGKETLKGKLVPEGEGDDGNMVKIPLTVLTAILDMVRGQGDYEKVALMEIDLSPENVDMLTQAIETVMPETDYGRLWALNELKGVDYDNNDIEPAE